MADALCGPSNALQTFQKQTSVDRTLQQDRLSARQGQAETFRSDPGPNAGILDAEFEAFQAGHPLEAGYPEPQLFSHAGPASSFQSNFQQPQPGSSNWASDFRNLSLDQTLSSPIPQSQFQQHAPLQRHTPAGWHQDFLRQQNQPSHIQPEQQQRPATGWLYGYTGGLIPQQDSALSPMAQQKQPEMHADNLYDEAAFEKAFENVRSEMQQLEDQFRQKDTQFDQDLYRTKDAGKNLISPESESWLDQSRIGSDRILDDAQAREEQNKDDNDADELARTAGQLLENVKGDQSQKFQESNFLSLMRQLRDKEVRVEGEKLVDVSMPPPTF